MNPKFNNIFLIGPMGAGKNTIGRQLAERSGLQFYDSDQEIESRAGVSISWIFEQETEAGFRNREHEAIQRLTRRHHIILATGGGVVMTAGNNALLKQNGILIYLKVPLRTQVQRIVNQKAKRPLYTTPEQLNSLNKTREPLYEQLADLTYSTDSMTTQMLAKKIMEDWQQLKANKKG